MPGACLSAAIRSACGEENTYARAHSGARLLSLHLALFPLKMLSVQESTNDRISNRNQQHFCLALLSSQRTGVLTCDPHAGLGKASKPPQATFQQSWIFSPSSPAKARPVLLGRTHKSLSASMESPGTESTLRWAIIYPPQGKKQSLTH